MGDGHQQRSADIAGLPLHPISLARVDNAVTFTDLLAASAALWLEQIVRLRLDLEQIRMKMNMPVFVGQRRPIAILAFPFIGQSGGRFLAPLELRHSSTSRP
jgi:hypothetical protein